MTTPTYTKQELQHAMDKAKIGILSSPDTAFISTVLFSLKLRFDTSLQPPTAATDSESLFVHPDFFWSLTGPERIGLLLHETWHVCWNHVFRGRDLQRNRYNYAADYIINLLIQSAGFTLPPKALLDSKYAGMSTREVYDMLPDDPNNDNSCYSPEYQDVMFDAPGKPSPATKAKQAKLTHTLLKGIQQAKMLGNSPGTIPGEIEVAVQELVNPKIPWQVQLQEYVTGMAKGDFSFRRPNRRFMPSLYLPIQEAPRLTEVCVAVDTSGSVRNDEFTSFLSEIHGIKEILNPEKLTILDFDTCIKAEHVLEEFDDLSQVKFHGRGGTDIHPVLEWATENQPAVMIIFSDMYFDMDDDVNPNCPVLWISVNNTNHDHLTFGEVIDFETD